MESDGEDDRGYRGVSTTPLLEVFNVTVHGRTNELFDPAKPCEIYGTITVANGLDDLIYLYKREQHDPEFIKLDETRGLSLTGPQSDVIIPYEYVTFEIHLWDRARKIIIAQGQLSLDYKECRYTQYGVESIQGQNSFANIHYATFPYAVPAQVDVIFFSKDDAFDPINGNVAFSGYIDTTDCVDGIVGDVYGTVMARSDFPGTRKDGTDTFSSILFNKSHDQCVQVKSKNFIGLSRYVVAVPALSPLQINVDFKYSDGSNLASGIATFEIFESATLKRDLGGENGCIRVLVKWGNAYEQLCRERKQKRTMQEGCSSEIEIEREESKANKLDKKQKLLTEPQCSSQSSSSCWVSPPLVPKERPGFKSPPLRMIEVFSVAIGSNILKPPFKVYGKIDFQDGYHGYIYEKDKSSVESCSDKLLVKGPNFMIPYGLDDFGIYVDLKDVEDHVLSYGYVPWSCRVFDRWFNKRICTLVRGDHGYAAMHYAIFSDGLLAKVKVSFKNLNTTLDFPLNAYGSLVAQYSTYGYSNLYEKNYYQSTLLQKGSDDSLVLPSCNSEMLVPLLKSVVAVPKNSALIIKADMFANSNQLLYQGVEVFKGCVKFSAQDQSSKVISGQNYCMEVSVQWRHVRDELC